VWKGKESLLIRLWAYGWSVPELAPRGIGRRGSGRVGYGAVWARAAERDDLAQLARVPQYTACGRGGWASMPICHLSLRRVALPGVSHAVGWDSRLPRPSGPPGPARLLRLTVLALALAWAGCLLGLRPPCSTPPWGTRVLLG
jgi:hypothetical protein